MGKTTARDLPFLKHVLPEDVHKKTGMNICVFGDYDIAGNLTLIAKLINKYTIHKARCIIVVGDYLDYDSDIVIMPVSGGEPSKESMDEASKIINNADFFHIGRLAVNFGNIKFNEILNKNNCVFQYFGSHLRQNKGILKKFHDDSGIHAVTWVDWTMQDGSGFMHYHLPDIFDVNSITPWYKNSAMSMEMDTIRIAHSPTNREFKKTDFFISVIDKLKKDFKIELVLLEGLSNKECLNRKMMCHILFDQISVGRFALSAIESMAMGHAVLCSVSNIVQSVFPRHPVISVTENTLEEKLRKLLSDKDSILDIGIAGRKWVAENCDPKIAIQQWTYLYDLIVNGNRIIESDEFFINLKEM